MKTRAAVATAPNTDLTITELELDDLRPDEVRVRMVASGVCHTDAIVRDQFYPTPLPAVLGHEGSGVIEEVGAAVTGFEVGDHVVLSYSSCGQCESCLKGDSAYCLELYDRNFGGSRPDGSTAFSKDGERISSHFFGQSSFAQYSNVPARGVVKIDKDAPLELFGPLGCGVQTGAGTVLNALKPEPGSSIVVFGAGAVGLSALMAAKVAQCGIIVAVDLHEQRLELAKELGATHTVVAGEPVAERIQEITNGGAKYVVDTTGVAPIFGDVVSCLAIRGTLAVAGAAPLGTDASFDVGTNLPKGITITMVVEGDAVPQIFIPQMIELYNKGLFPFDKLVKQYPLDQINQAFNDSASGETLKPVVLFD